MKWILVFWFLAMGSVSVAQERVDTIVTDKDREKDVLMITSMGEILIRLSDSTPLHRDNFLSLVKKGFYDSLLFHRVIQGFMIQGGDPDSKNAEPRMPLGNGGLPYTIPAEFRKSLYHKKGVIAAARDNNPAKASSSTQFYITQGKVFTNEGLDSLSQGRLKGRVFTDEERKIYTTIGGVPQLDQNYTIFGEVIRGLEVIDSIAAVETSDGKDKDRPIDDVMIRKIKLVKRKKKK